MNNTPQLEPEVIQSSSAIKIGFIFALASSALFAIRPIFVKLVYEQGVDSETLMVYRMIFSAPIYALMLVYLLRLKSRRAKLNFELIVKISFVGLFGYYAASLLDLLGLQYVTAQLGRMILYAYPTIVVLLGALFFAKAITRSIVISLVITYLGIFVIFSHDLKEFGPDVITGGLLILASALSFALYLLFSKDLIDKVGSQVFTCIALISASFGIYIHYSFTHTISTVVVNNTAMLLILIIAIFCTVIPTFFTAAAVTRIGADKTGIAAMIGPGFTSIFAVWILNEQFTLYHLIGIILIIIGVGFLQKKSTA